MFRAWKKPFAPCGFLLGVFIATMIEIAAIILADIQPEPNSFWPTLLVVGLFILMGGVVGVYAADRLDVFTTRKGE